jgi:deazaflavin-dependent oxidoreductase (nitroreductase family)
MSLQSGFLRLHQALYVRTDGRVGHRLIGVPSLILRTTGRRSGATRVAVLVYGREADGYVVVASNDGQDQPPAWLHNLRANPEVDLQVGRNRSPAHARIVEGTDPDHARLWALMNRVNHGRYDGYQRLTSRLIALVVLTPSPAGR